MDQATAAENHTDAHPHDEPVRIEDLPQGLTEGLAVNRWTMATIGQRRHVVEQVGPAGATLLFAIHALTDTNRRWPTPTNDDLTKLTGLGVGTVPRLLPYLKRAGFLEVHGRGRNRVFEVLPLADLEDEAAHGLPLDRWAKHTTLEHYRVTQLVGWQAAWTYQIIRILMGSPDARWDPWTPTATKQLAYLAAWDNSTIERHLTMLYRAGLLESTGSNQSRLLKPGAAFTEVTDPRVSRVKRGSGTAVRAPDAGPITRSNPLDASKASKGSHLRVVTDEFLQSELETQPLTRTCRVPDCDNDVEMRGHQYTVYCSGHYRDNWTGHPPEDPRSPFSTRFKPVHRQSKPVQKGIGTDDPDDTESEPDWTTLTPGEEWAIRQAQASETPPQPAAADPAPGADSDEPDDDTPVPVPQFVKDQLAELRRMAPSSLSYRQRPKPVKDLDEPDEPRPQKFTDPILHEQPPDVDKPTKPDEPPLQKFTDPVLHEQPPPPQPPPQPPRSLRARTRHTRAKRRLPRRR